MRISDWSSDVCSSDLSFFTIDRCESPAPLKHETQGALRVSMAWRDFAGQDQLQSGIQARNDGRLAYAARILENEHASFCLLGADQIACAHQEIPSMPVPPRVRAPRGDRNGGR